MKYGNCIIWAFTQKFLRGGIVKVELLKPYWFVPRAFYSPDGENWFRFAPDNPVLSPTILQKIFPIHVLLFKGHVKKVKV